MTKIEIDRDLAEEIVAMLQDAGCLYGHRSNAVRREGKVAQALHLSERCDRARKQAQAIRELLEDCLLSAGEFPA